MPMGNAFFEAYGDYPVDPGVADYARGAYGVEPDVIAPQFQERDTQQVDINVPSFLPPDIVAQLNQSGWYGGGKPTEKGGKPQTFEEQQFVIDYLGQHGMLPVAGQGNQFQQTGTYDPMSTMGGLGWENYNQYVRGQFANETYGPLAGRDVPTNAGIVVTDSMGNPVARYMDVNKPEAQRAIEAGRYINTGELQGGFRDARGSYNQPSPYKTWQQPGMEEALGALPPSQIDEARMLDYLTMLGQRDETIVQNIYSQKDTLAKALKDQITTINESLLAGQISESEAKDAVDAFNVENQRANIELDRQLDPLVTTDKAKQIILTARSLIDRGYSGQDLVAALLEQLQASGIENIPDLSGSLTAEGENLMNLYNQAIGGREVKNKYGDVIGMEGGLKQAWEREQTNQPATWTGYPPSFEELQPQPWEEEDTRQNFQEYANSLDITPEYRNWLFEQYGYYGSLWYKSEAPEFLPWLNNILARG